MYRVYRWISVPAASLQQTTKKGSDRNAQTDVQHLGKNTNNSIVKGEIQPQAITFPELNNTGRKT